MLLHKLFIVSFITSSARFIEFYAGKVILFEIKVNARNIKETTLDTLVLRGYKSLSE